MLSSQLLFCVGRPSYKLSRKPNPAETVGQQGAGRISWAVGRQGYAPCDTLTMSYQGSTTLDTPYALRLQAQNNTQLRPQGSEQVRKKRPIKASRPLWQKASSRSRPNRAFHQKTGAKKGSPPTLQSASSTTHPHRTVCQNTRGIRKRYPHA